MIDSFNRSKVAAKERLVRCKSVDRAAYTNPYEDVKKELEEVLKKYFSLEGEIKLEITPLGKRKGYITAGVLAKDAQIN